MRCDALDDVIDGIITEPDECDFRPEVLAPRRRRLNNFTDYGLRDIARSDALNAGGIRTFYGELSALRDRGGMFLTYHGRRDPLIASTNSKRMYELIAQMLHMRTFDAFYCLFLVPGMGYCHGGAGGVAFGQGIFAGSNAVNTSSHNALLALVDWAERGTAPDEIIGSPADGEGWVCV
ncbi:tannase and feruloyl esterase-domain-containing protein [Mycena latifolia]|nr:tannase and feruloyl esterase-domain-containing protein [Mycena latifolia]